MYERALILLYIHHHFIIHRKLHKCLLDVDRVLLYSDFGFLSKERQRKRRQTGGKTRMQRV